MNFFLVSIVIVFIFGFMAGRFTFSNPSSKRLSEDSQAACPAPPVPKAKNPNANTQDLVPKTEAASEQELLAQMAQNSPCAPELTEDTYMEEVGEDNEDDGVPLDANSYEEMIRNGIVPAEEGPGL